MHLGRRPSRLSGPLLEHQDAASLGPAEAWRRSVELAIRQNVVAVLFVGDLVEQSDDFFEAFGDLRSGVERLAAAGIKVIGVAGNHDVEVLPRLADAIPEFHLLGRNGQWEMTSLGAHDGCEIHVLGWSFPELTVNRNPLHSELPPLPPGLTIGLLHCDRDQSRSRYAPVSSADLDRVPVDAWLLGHIHKPDSLTASRPFGYLGSITGLDPGERGSHGPWMLEVANGRIASISHMALAPLRWEDLSVSVEGLGRAEDLGARIVSSVRNLHALVIADSDLPLVVGCGLRLEGRTNLQRQIEQMLNNDDPRTFVDTIGGITYFIHSSRLDVEPELNIEELAHASDPAGVLARQLLILRSTASPERDSLIRHARVQIEAAANQQEFVVLERPETSDDWVASTLEESAMYALGELLAQQERIE